MPGAVIGKSLNFGYPGNVSRSVDAIITNRIVKPTDTDPIGFGEAAVLNPDNTYSKFGATGTHTSFAGVAVREIKQSTVFANNISGEYKPAEPCDVIERGTVTVVCRVGTPVAGASVHVRIAENPAFPDGVVGGFEAAADGSNTINLPNVRWKTGKLDANRVGEITILTRNNP